MRITNTTPAVLAMLVATSSIAQAESRAVLVSGTALGQGQVDIIIEDNDDPNRAPSAIFAIDVVIQDGNTAVQSAQVLRDTLDLELPPIYNVSIFDMTTVVIDRLGPIVDFSVSDNVPQQTFVEVPPPGTEGGRRAPIMPLTLFGGGAAMLVLAVRRLRRR